MPAANATRHFKPWLLWVGAGVAAAWALTMIWWALLEPNSVPDSAEVLVIPMGTADAVAAGDEAPFIPNSLSLGRSGKLIVHNEDVVEHSVGAWVIPPGGSAEIVAPEDAGQVSCTIHPGGFLGVTLDERPPVTSTIIPSLLLGLPIGLVMGFAAFVGGRLNMGDGPGAGSSHRRSHVSS